MGGRWFIDPGWSGVNLGNSLNRMNAGVSSVVRWLLAPGMSTGDWRRWKSCGWRWILFATLACGRSLYLLAYRWLNAASICQWRRARLLQSAVVDGMVAAAFCHDRLAQAYRWRLHWYQRGRCFWPAAERRAAIAWCIWRAADASLAVDRPFPIVPLCFHAGRFNRLLGCVR